MSKSATLPTTLSAEEQKRLIERNADTPKDDWA